MRQFKVGERTITLNEKDYATLLYRFDLANSTHNELYFYIGGPLRPATIEWGEASDVEARAEIKAIHDFLLSLEKVTRRRKQ